MKTFELDHFDSLETAVFQSWDEVARRDDGGTRLFVTSAVNGSVRVLRFRGRRRRNQHQRRLVVVRVAHVAIRRSAYFKSSVTL